MPLICANFTTMFSRCSVLQGVVRLYSSLNSPGTVLQDRQTCAKTYTAQCEPQSPNGRCVCVHCSSFSNLMFEHFHNKIWDRKLFSDERAINTQGLSLVCVIPRRVNFIEGAWQQVGLWVSVSQSVTWNPYVYWKHRLPVNFPRLGMQAITRRLSPLNGSQLAWSKTDLTHLRLFQNRKFGSFMEETLNN